MGCFSHLFNFFTATTPVTASSKNLTSESDHDQMKQKQIITSTEKIIKRMSSPIARTTFDTKKRLEKELQDIITDPPDHCSGGLIVEDDMFIWRGAIIGPSDSPFEDGVFYVSISFPLNYPFEPPNIKFETKVYHPNIDMMGNIDVDILKKQWSPALQTSKLLLSICSLLTDPNANDSSNPIAYIYRNDRKKYDKIARAWTKKYAILV